MLQSRQANKMFDGRKVLLNSNSERKEINLKYDKSAVETMHKASSQDMNRPMTPKMADMQTPPNKDQFPQKSTFSQVNIESSVLEAASTGKRADSQNS